MNTDVLNYRVIIEPETYPNGKRVYNAYCPTLGIADYADTVDEALVNIKEAITFTLEYLAEEKQSIPVDNPDEQIVTTAKISIPSGLKLNFA